MLVGILDKAINDPEPFMYGDDDSIIPAAFLLSQLREKSAYPKLIELISYNEDEVDLLWGDVLTDSFNHILRDTFDGDPSPLQKLIEKRRPSPWSRSIALYAMGMHYFDGHITREYITAYFRRLIHEVYTGEPSDDDEIVLTALADVIREHQLKELTEDVMLLYSKDAVDEYVCGNKDEYIQNFYNPLYGPTTQHIDDTIKELERWKWFTEEKLPEDEEDEDFDDDNDFDEDDFDDFDDEDDDY
jgi:hypothetical protein